MGGWAGGGIKENKSEKYDLRTARGAGTLPRRLREVSTSIAWQLSKRVLAAPVLGVLAQALRGARGPAVSAARADLSGEASGESCSVQAAGGGGSTCGHRFCDEGRDMEHYLN